MNVPERFIRRALARRNSPDENGCMTTTGTPRPDGYGFIQGSVGPRGSAKSYSYLQHRLVWLSVYGEPPGGAVIHHNCFNRACCNIEHLAIMSRGENAARANGQDWSLGTCKRGHSRDNWKPGKHGRNECQLCIPIWKAAQKERYRKRIEVRHA